MIKYLRLIVTYSNASNNKPMDKTIHYISYSKALDIYAKTIENSGGGLQGIRDEGGFRAVLDFIEHDEYYPTYIDKLAYLVFRLCSGHFFADGNKRIALTMGVYFLHINNYHWEACYFMKRFEAIIYHVAASNINEELLKRLIHSFMTELDFDEALKLDLLTALNQSIR